MGIDLSNGRVLFTGPTVMQVIGSSVAHMHFTYSNGALWLSGRGVIYRDRISPATGDVVNRYSARLEALPG
jgi:hypothetical protein